MSSRQHSSNTAPISSKYKIEAISNFPTHPLTTTINTLPIAKPTPPTTTTTTASNKISQPSANPPPTASTQQPPMQNNAPVGMVQPMFVAGVPHQGWYNMPMGVPPMTNQMKNAKPGDGMFKFSSYFGDYAKSISHLFIFIANSGVFMPQWQPMPMQNMFAAQNTQQPGSNQAHGQPMPMGNMQAMPIDPAMTVVQPAPTSGASSNDNISGAKVESRPAAAAQSVPNDPALKLVQPTPINNSQPTQPPVNQAKSPLDMVRQGQQLMNEQVGCINNLTFYILESR